MGCAAPRVATKTTLVEVKVIERVQVPDALLVPCDVAPLPRRRARWGDVLVLTKVKHEQQLACNERFEIIRGWQTEADE